MSSFEDLAVQRVQLTLASTFLKPGEEVSRPDLGSALKYYGKNGIIWLIFFVGVMALVALPYTLVPTSFDFAANATAYVSYEDALYFAWITGSTVGYGSLKDPCPRAHIPNACAEWEVMPSWLRPYVIAQLCLSISLLGGLVSHFSHLQGQRAAKLQQQRVLKIELTEGLISQLDRDGDGVDKLEFVIGMLSKVRPRDLTALRPVISPRFASK